MILTMDTNAYSALKSGDPKVQSFLEEAEQILVPSIVVGELLSGFMMGTRFARNTAELDEFLGQPGIVVQEIGFSEANRYASLVKALRNAGTPVPTNDIWIASVALAEGGRVLTRDAHFEKIPGIVPIAY